MINLKDFITESTVSGVVFLTSDNWAHITTGQDRWEDMNVTMRAMTDAKFEKFFNKVIKTKFVKACKKDGLNIAVDYLNSISCSFKGVDETNVDVFFKHFYEMMTTAGYTLYADDIYSLFAKSDIKPEIVQILIDEYSIK